jgi:methionyl-tRNA formyltransferase
MTLRVIFMGTPDFAVPVLEALVAAGHDVVRVLTQPPSQAGRGKKLRPSPIHLAAEALGLEVRAPHTLKDKDVQDELGALGADVGIVVAYGQILPQAVLEGPRLGYLNLHGSLLPRWRGAAPVQRALLAGDAETGVQVMQMEAGLDTGPVFSTWTMPIGDDTNFGDVHDTLSENGARLMVEALGGIDAGTLKATPQSEEGMTYAKKIAKEEVRIDWSSSATQIDRQVRAFAPQPGAWFEAELRGKTERIRILKAHSLEGKGGPGEIVRTPLVVGCGEGLLGILEVQRAGKKPASVEAFLNGAMLEPGMKVS